MPARDTAAHHRKTALPLAFALAAHRSVMAHPALRGRSILVVENELLIAMDIAQALESAGRERHDDDHVRHALILIEHCPTSAPVRQI